MSNTIQHTQSGERLTFHQLFDEKGYHIQIPIIQRDYAQGRPSTVEVRNMFLDAIKTYLDENIKNRDLDFVYGNLLVENGTSTTRFIPLDGQQRLTTLFLLHWYLANKDNKINEFKAFIVEKNKSKFTYETRPSSSEFCDALLNNTINLSELLEADENEQNDLSKTIKDSNWYFSSWDNDPTIKSMLVMFDAIHLRFFETINYYERLVNKQNPIITFQFLNLKEFKLTDDLYIKMNARGKPLTPFENFKAKFEQLINITKYTSNPIFKLSYSGVEKKVTVAEYFSNKIDTDWANLFWKYRNKKTNIFDEQLMNLFRALAATHLAIKLAPAESTLNIKFLLDRKNDSITFNQLKGFKCFDEFYIIELIELLDLLKNGEDTVKCNLNNTNYYNELEAFNSIVNNSYNDAAYTSRIQFYAYCQYLIYWKHEAGLETWMRVVYDLSENTGPYNNEGEFIRSIKSINKLLSVSNDILTYLSRGDDVDGFSQVQIEEERLKATLILKDSTWADLIYSAEKELKYFKGQLSYLLSFSGITKYYLTNKNCNWDTSTNTALYKSFVFYVNKSKLIFDDDGLKELGGYIWQRALLTKGNYLINEGSNSSFLINNDRDISWKRLLLADKKGDEHKAIFVKNLMDDPAFNDIKVEVGLNQIITNSIAQITDWKRHFIVLTELFKCLGPKKYIRLNSDYSIYLLSGQKKSGTYYEYYTYSMFWKYFIGKAFAPFTTVFYYDVNGEDEEPCIVLGEGFINNSSFELDIYFNANINQYHLSFFDGNKIPFDDLITQILTKQNFILNASNTAYENNKSEADLMQCINDLIEDLQSIQV